MAGQKGRSGGQNRKTAAEHKLSGTYRDDRHGKFAAADPKLVEPEAYITNVFTTDKQELFKRFALLLNADGLTSSGADALLVSQIVDLYDAYVQAAAIYAAEGVGARVGPKLAINLMIELQKEMRIMLGEYNLTPSTRGVSTILGTSDGGADPIAAFASGGKPTLVKS